MNTHMILTQNDDYDLNWQMPWQEFDVTLGKSKIIHLNNLNITNYYEAHEFLMACGFNMSDYSHAKSLDQYYCEAIFFIRHVLFTKEERYGIEVPKKILEIQSFCDVLIIASNTTPQNKYYRAWACAILKVVNAIANIEYSTRIHELEQARKVIFDKIKNVVRHNGDSWIAQFQKHTLHLAHVDWKEAKTRNSFILKLLHKPDFIADDIFDHLGVRFVVFNHSDVPKLLRLLIASKIILAHYVVTGRTRNNMIHLDSPRKLLQVCHDLLSNGTISQDEYIKMCNRVPWQQDSTKASTGRETNNHSSADYRSLQITVRHLIRIPNPVHFVLQNVFKDMNSRNETGRSDSWVNHFIPEEVVHFFPLEIQILDYRGYEQSKFGKASHERYKASQLSSVRSSILGQIWESKDTHKEDFSHF